MRAMLLTAGFGERMYPLTATLAKPAIPVLGRPLVVQSIRWLARARPEHVVLNLHHLPDTLEDLLGDGSHLGLPPLLYRREESILGTAGGIRNARDLLIGDGPVVVCNGDVLTDIDLEAALAAHAESRLPATLVTAETREGYGRIPVGRDGRVLALRGQPEVDPALVEAERLFTGCQILEREVLEAIPEGATDTVADVYIDLARERRLGSFHHPGFWREFGDPDRYLDGSVALLHANVETRQRITDHDPIRRMGDAVGAIGSGARYDRRAEFHGYNAIGFESLVSEGCRLEHTMILPQSRIGPDCSLSECIVAGGLEIPAGFEARRSLIARHPGGEDPRLESMERCGDLVRVPLDREAPR